MTFSKPWPVMQTKDSIARKLFKESILNHFLCAGTTLFRGLKNKND